MLLLLCFLNIFSDIFSFFPNYFFFDLLFLTHFIFASLQFCACVKTQVVRSSASLCIIIVFQNFLPIANIGKTLSKFHSNHKVRKTFFPLLFRLAIFSRNQIFLVRLIFLFTLLLNFDNFKVHNHFASRKGGSFCTLSLGSTPGRILYFFSMCKIE